MQPDHAVNWQVMAMQLLHAKEQETRHLLTLMQNQHQVLWLQVQQQQTLIDQQGQLIDQFEAEVQAYRSAERSSFGLVHTN